MKGGIGWYRIEFDNDRYYNFTSICCAYTEKMVKNVIKRLWNVKYVRIHRIEFDINRLLNRNDVTHFATGCPNKHGHGN